MADILGITRVEDGRMVAGVLAGIARRFDVSADTVRLVYAAVTIFSAGFPGVIVYLVLWALLPQEHRFRD